MTVLVVDMSYRPGSLSRFEFVRPIVRILGEERCRVVHRSDLPTVEQDECDAMLLCGTALMDDAFTDDEELTDALLGWDRPLLGICAGMQALCTAHGCELTDLTEIGMTPVTPVGDWLAGLTEAYQLHVHSVALNDAFVLLAENEAGPQAVKLKEREHYGILFHPEVRNEWVVRRWSATVCPGR